MDPKDKPAAPTINPEAEDRYWREKHAEQPYASAEHSYEHYAPAYRVGYEAAEKYPGRHFDEVEDDVALDYEKNQPGSALPWDQVRAASRAAWHKVSGLISPREGTRGIRGSI